MQEEVSSPDHSDEELNYRQFMELHKETKTKRGRATRLPKQIEPLKHEAMKLFINGDLTKCKEKVMEMITIDPKNPDSYFMMGEVHELDGDKIRAAHYFSLSIELSVPNPRLWEKIGDLYYDIEFFQQAAYCYGRCLKSDPLNGEVLLKRGRAYENAEEFRKALAMYYKLLKIGPNLTIIKDSARLHCKLGQFDKAREILRQAGGEDMNVVYMICQTLMKEGKYGELMDEISSSVLKGGELDPEKLMSQFLKMVVIAGYALGLSETQQYFEAIMAQLDEDTVDLFESLVKELNSLGRKQQSAKIILSLINNGSVIKKPEYYLKLAQHYSSKNQLAETSAILQRGSKMLPADKNIRSELGFLKIKMGDLERGVEMVKDKGEEEEEDEEEIYISDLSEDEKPIKASKVMKKPNIVAEETKVSKKKQKSEKRKGGKMKERKDESEDEDGEEYQPYSPTRPSQQNELKANIDKRISHLHQAIDLQKEDPHILLQLYTNIQTLLKDVVQYYNKLKQDTFAETYIEEKPGLFSKKLKHRKRRTRAEHKETIKEQHLAQLLHTWITHVFRISCWFKIFSLSTTISKLLFLKKYPEEMKRIYQLCVLACLEFKRYRRAFFLLRYLLSEDTNNMFYILLCNLLIRKINAPKTARFVLAKLSHHQNKYPNISYLIAFEHLNSGYFDHSIKSLIKIPPSSYNQQTIMLCFVSCFIQMASSRNTTDKLSMVNRATYMMNEYRKVVEKRGEKSFELYYNMGRFYHQLRVSSKAMEYYEEAIRIGRERKCENLSKAVYCLMFLYRELEEHAKYSALCQQYFSI